MDCPKDSFDAADVSLPAKRPRLSLSLPKDKRFSSPIKKEKFDEAAQGVVPTNTAYSTQWAVRTWTEWMTQRNSKVSSTTDAVPIDLLQSHDAEIVAKYLRLFVLEARRIDGQHYPPSTIRALLCGLQRVMQASKVPFNFFDKGDQRFRELHLTLDTVSSELHRNGIGATRNSAQVISTQDEELFWDKGCLGISSPVVLQRTVFFYVGLHFVLRGVQEQHELVPQQFVRNPSDRTIYSADVYYQYTEFISKNNQHRFKDAKVKNKEVRVYSRPGTERCLVKMLDVYLSKLPHDS